MEKGTEIATEPSEINPDTQVLSIPGNTLLVDVKHSESSDLKTSNDIVLIPRPTSDPDDPLNWSPMRKNTAMFIVCFWAFMLGATTLSYGVTYVSLMQQFNTTIDYLNVGAAVALLFLGLANLVLNPLALRFGRRPVYIFSALIVCVSQIICASAQSKETFTGGRILLGIAAAPFEQLPAVTVDDQYFIHQRGLGMSFYVLAISTGSFLGPVASGFVVENLNLGWRWVYWFYAIIMGAVTLLMVVGLEETGGYPSHVRRAMLESNATEPKTPRGFWAGRSLYRSIPLTKGFFATALAPFRLAAWPILVWCGFMYGFGVSWLSVMAFTAATVFQGPTYRFSASATGLTNLAPLVGAVLMIYVGGAGTDKWMIYKARRAGGYMKPESRLYAIFIGGPIMTAGLMLYGVGAAHAVHWFVPVFGMALIGSALPLIAEVALGYTCESYPLLAGEATTLVVCIRNIIGCAMTFAITPWIEHSGLQNTFITVGILASVVMLSGSFFLWKGEACRRKSMITYHQMTESLGHSG